MEFSEAHRRVVEILARWERGEIEPWDVIEDRKSRLGRPLTIIWIALRALTERLRLSYSGMEKEFPVFKMQPNIALDLAVAFGARS